MTVDRIRSSGWNGGEMGICLTGLSELLEHLFAGLNAKRVDYCVCGNYEGLPRHTDNDVDLWVSEVDTAQGILEEVANGLGFHLYLRNRTGNGTNNFLFRENGDGSLSLLHLDLMRDLSWFSFFTLVNAQVIRRNRMPYRGFMVANPKVEAIMHFLYPLMAKGTVKEKYRAKASEWRQDQDFREHVQLCFGTRGGSKILALLDAGDWDSVGRLGRRLRWRRLATRLFLPGPSTVVGVLRFVKANFARCFHPQGLTVAFVGIDGCGKTTVIDRLRPVLTRAFTYGKVRFFYWRPFLLPRLKQLLALARGQMSGSPETNPATPAGQERVSRTISAAKFFYYLSDYALGRVKYFGATRRGGVAVFDRYYDDLLVYPERFGLTVPRPLVGFFRRVVPRPDLVFLLDVSAEAAWRRKQELPLAEARRQVVSYHELASEDHRFRVVPSEDGRPDETARAVFLEMVRFLGNRLKGV